MMGAVSGGFCQRGNAAGKRLGSAHELLNAVIFKPDSQNSEIEFYNPP
jgi:hypothetical protein